MTSGGSAIPEPRQELTKLLNQIQGGDARAVDRLTPVLYTELRHLARQKLYFERRNHTLNTTALVHEAYLHLVDQRQVTWESRAHFLAIAATIMRRILLSYAARRKTLKRGGDAARVPLDEIHEAISEARADELLALDEALLRFAAFDKRGAQIVEYRYFAGLTQKEIAEVLGISERTVRRTWFMAKAWLIRELTE